MIKIAFGLIGALLLASCAYTGPQTAAVPAQSSLNASMGHPDPSYPGPRPY